MVAGRLFRAALSKLARGRVHRRTTVVAHVGFDASNRCKSDARVRAVISAVTARYTHALHTSELHGMLK